MANYGIKPTRSASGVLVLSQTIAVSSSSSTSFGTFSTQSNIVAVQFRGGDVFATFDGSTTPGTTAGFQLYGSKAYHWDINNAKSAKFIGVSGSVTAASQEYQIYLGDTQLPDTSVIKSLAAP